MDLLRVIFGAGLLVVGLVFLLAARDEYRRLLAARDEYRRQRWMRDYSPATSGPFAGLIVISAAAVSVGAWLLGII
jgi:hypothetical protein